MKDLVEGKLLQQIQDINLTAIIYYLTQARDRGYQEQQALDPNPPDVRPFVLEVNAKWPLDRPKRVEAPLVP